ncbi:LOG family protein [Candidatus Methylacidithermus pantelleriae]|uniref:AMP nucleosidase n=1 Tax=Candidatus Methylacidithermus pantelleriae TaxID=2744239 RepID=A0A8J2BLA2_9BACT|nr:LOG family protein [Candidatus Methylacidithermus pantelleriae]CAF0704589.1 3-isopropylmalate dehydrogenase [Candidatus Methylacidithermus pantelleriae]
MNLRKYRTYSTGKPEWDHAIFHLLEAAGLPAQREYFEILARVITLGHQGASAFDARLVNFMLADLCRAIAVFHPYRGIRKIAIFGSARLSPDSPVGQAARKFASMMAESGFMVLTGGGSGIMEAAQAGAGREKSFGLNILLPFEQRPNEVIEGDPKLIHFRYFFLRKLFFLKESHAIALFPGGFGTMDEGFEALTLMQTGKAAIEPLVFVDCPGGIFWKNFERYLRENLLAHDLISESDFSLFRFTESLEEARDEVLRFYDNFHSYRFLGARLIIRIRRPIPEEVLEEWNAQFRDILTRGRFELRKGPLPGEGQESELAHLYRLCFSFNRSSYGRLRQLIDRINEY